MKPSVLRSALHDLGLGTVQEPLAVRDVVARLTADA
jgi:hypothetical protein